MITVVQNTDSKTLNVLLIEDNPGDARLIQETLAEADTTHFELTHMNCISAGMERLAEGGIDIVLLDLSLPDSQGLETFVKIHSQASDVPIVVLSGLYDETIAVKAVHRGAQDYLVKGYVDNNLLVRSIRYAIERHRMLEEMEKTQQQQMQIKDQFLSHISHELRTPLTATHQFVTIILDGLAGDLNPEQREYLEIALKNINQLKNMISELLDITRSETGKLNVNPWPISIAEVISDTLNTLKAAATEKGIILTSDIHNDLPSVFADKNRVQQILINLVDNGIKFTTEKGMITIRAKLFDKDPNFLCIEVSDNGCGINQEETQMIFDRLHQIQNSVEDSRKGLGLGLYICKMLVSRHGGRIWVKSRLGEGSTFYFTLPIYTLADLLSPIIVKGNRFVDSVAFIKVEVSFSGRLLSAKTVENVRSEVESILRNSTIPSQDVVLPMTTRTKRGLIFFIVACAGKSGVDVIRQRLMKQLSHSRDIKCAIFDTTISNNIIDIASRTCDKTLEQRVKDMSTCIEKLIQATINERKD